ncbi:MAG TPA: RHS repeat-associated core domain-containing protein [Caldisericia bacterium]|nr:RHS repeat-associated core domain-containing protein [Caldisericia bacterium]
MRGSVIALTDEDGYIIETYSYDPFGNILSTPTIYNSKLFIGRDDILYDTETDLYYMHARYYDPEAGRFIMKDQTEGLLPNYIDGKKKHLNQK